MIERVTDCLSERNPDYRNGLALEDTKHFDPCDERKGYLRLQNELCDLGLAERSTLGRRFADAVGKAERASKPAMTFCAAHLDSKPDFVYVFISGRGEPRSVLIEGASQLLQAAMAFYNKRRGMFIVDRDSISFEVRFQEVTQHSIAAFHWGEIVFGNLHIDHVPASLVPSGSGG